jgi:hypothetical protein
MAYLGGRLKNMIRFEMVYGQTQQAGTYLTPKI